MNVEEMYLAMNKGIPNQIPLELSVEELVEYCSENQEELSSAMNSIRRDFENAMISISGYTKAKHEFFDNLRLITNYKNSDTQIYVSPVCFINRLKEILGVKSESMDLEDSTLMEEFRKRLDRLEYVTNLDELQLTFPAIYEDYQYSFTIPKDAQKEYFQKRGLSTDFKTFLSEQKEMYHSLVNNAKYIEDFANEFPINLDMFEGLDKDKFELYVAKKYLDFAKNCDEAKYKQRAIYYLTTYLNESCGNYKSMEYKDKELSNLSLLKDFRRFLMRNRELKPVNESRDVFHNYHIKHVKNHINKYFDGLKNWYAVKLTPEEIINNQKARLLRIQKYNQEHPEEETRDSKHKKAEKYMKMLLRKLNFYENSDYALRLFGTGPFESHVAYFYPNGMVAVDKLFYESLNINPTYNEAIYVMDTNTFLNMMKMDKPALRENDNVKRIVHSRNWEERLKKEIESPTIQLDQEEAKVLTNKYKPNK
jgi:hypothetical protein